MSCDITVPHDGIADPQAGLVGRFSRGRDFGWRFTVQVASSHSSDGALVAVVEIPTPR